MLKLNAVFHRKDINLLPRNCVVEKIVPLTRAKFTLFASDLLSDWDFIKDNVDLMRMDRDGTYHCILVTGEGCENGILVESEGASYARYAAHVPHVQSIIAANQYPAVADLINKLTAVTEPEQTQETYNSVTLLNKPALFTCLRVDHNTIPSGLFAYDIRHNDKGMAVSVEPNVSANHMGTVITSESLDFGKNGYIALNNKNGGLNFACDHGCTTIAEYNKYLQNSSQTQTTEPEQTREMTMSM